jgi:hypothetical protein
MISMRFLTALMFMMALMILMSWWPGLLKSGMFVVSIMVQMTVTFMMFIML